MKIISPETREELKDLLWEIFGCEVVEREVLFSRLGLTSPIDQAKFLSLAGCKTIFSIEEIADVLWGQSNYAEAERD